MSLHHQDASEEQPAAVRPGVREMLSDTGWVYLGSAIIAFIFAASAPVAIILSVGSRGGLDAATLSSWVFGAFFINGLISIYFCWRYRQPLVFLWSIPGTVLVGPALANVSFPEVVGAFLATGVLMAVLGASGLVRRVMDAAPMPIVMAMVAGVFLGFGLDLVHALRDDFWLAAPMVAVFVALSVLPGLGRRLPPLIGALLVGIVLAMVMGRFQGGGAETVWLARPELQAPAFSWQAMVELVIPLAITVLVAQNAQGIAVLRSAGYEPPVSAITVACGAGSIVSGFVGTVSTCLTGPVNAILASAGQKHRQYIGGIMVGLLALAFGIMAPLFTHWMLGAPAAFISTLAGLALLRVLQTAFTESFRDRFTLGALVTFLVTVADVPIFGIGAPFWGLVFGYLTSRLLEAGDFRTKR